MRHQFEGSDHDQASDAVVEVREVAQALDRQTVKLAAAFARIRVERQARGDSIQERLLNILPEKERTMDEMAGIQNNCKKRSLSIIYHHFHDEDQLPVYVFRVENSETVSSLSGLTFRADPDFPELKMVHGERQKLAASKLDGYLCENKIDYALVEFVARQVRMHGTSKSKVLVTHPKSGRIKVLECFAAKALNFVYFSSEHAGSLVTGVAKEPDRRLHV